MQHMVRATLQRLQQLRPGGPATVQRTDVDTGAGQFALQMRTLRWNKSASL
jgi:hypothetical protein